MMKKAILVVLAFALLLTLSSCSLIRNRIANTIRKAVSDRNTNVETQLPEATKEAVRATEKPGEPADTGEPAPSELPAATDAFTNDATLEDVPDFVPPFNYGSLNGQYSSKIVYEGTETYSFQMEGVSEEDVKAYNEALKDAGFENYYAEGEGYITVMGTLQLEGNRSASVMVSLDANGLCVYSVILYQES